MPNSKPQKDETYLCTPYKLDTERDAYIVGFHPNATSKVGSGRVTIDPILL